MAKHNYSQYSNKKNDNKVDATPENTVENQNENITAVVEEVETTVEAVVENNTVTEAEAIIEPESTTESNSGAVAKGVVANCAKLNVRSKPSVKGNVITVLNVDDEVSIDVNKSTNEWFKINTVDGVKGYCMRKFVNANI
jgi:SH3-like domain-containing protein